MYRGRSTKVLSVLLSLVITVSVLLSGLCLNEPETVNAAGNETYTAIGGYSTLVNIKDSTGSTFRGYCLNSSKHSWSAGDTFSEIDFDYDGDNSELADYIKNYQNADLLTNIKRVLYFGYPYDPLGLMQRYALSASSMRSLTQSAIWHYTNGSSGITGSSNQAAAYRELIDAVEDSTRTLPDGIEMKLLTTGDLSEQAAGILVFTNFPTHSITIEKLFRDDLGNLTTLGGVGFELTYTRDYQDLIPVLPSLGSVQVLQYGQQAVSYAFDHSNNTISFTTVPGENTVINRIPQGNYVLRETFAPNGCEKRVYYFKVLSNGDVQSIMEDGSKITTAQSNWQSVSGSTLTAINATPTPTPTPAVADDITFIKTDPSGNALPGTTFELRPLYHYYSSRPDVDLSGITVEGADNVTYSSNLITFTTKGEDIHFKNVLQGYYYLKEISAPDEYKLASNYYFRITSDAKVEKLSSYTNTSGSIVTQIKIVNSLKPTPTPVIVTTTPVPRSISLSKVIWGSSELLGGAGFEMYPLYQETQTFDGQTINDIDLSGITVDRADEIEYDASSNRIKFTTIEGNNVVFNNVPEGFYVLKEVSVPAGYEKAYDSLIVYVTPDIGDGQPPVWYGPLDNNASISGMWPDYEIMYYNTTPTPSVTPPPVTYDITISKSDGTDLVPGATLKLSYTGIGSVTLSATQGGAPASGASQTGNSISFTTVDGSDTVISGLLEGNYILTETSYPQGYKQADAIYFSVDSSGHIIKNGNDIGTTVTMTDERVQVLSAGFAISKQITGGSSELPGAVLTIKNVSGQTIDLSSVTATQNGASASDFTPNSDEVTFKTVENYETVITNLPEGSYILSESTAPLGFNAASDISFSIDSTGAVVSNALDPNGVIVMYDSEKVYSFSIKKTDPTDGSFVTGATLTLSNAQGTATDLSSVSVTDAASGSVNKLPGEVSFNIDSSNVTISNIPAGTYVLTETAAPAGYETAPDITVTVERGGNILVNGSDNGGSTVVMDDAPKAALGFNLTKMDMQNYDIIGGAVFELGCLDRKDASYTHRDLSQAIVNNAADINYDAQTNTISFKTIAERKVLFNNLYPGYYYITEVQSPYGFDMYPGYETLYFRIQSDGTLLMGYSITQINMTTYNNTRDFYVPNVRNADYQRQSPTPTISVDISKVRIAGNGYEEIEGATLTLTGTEPGGGAISFLRSQYSGSGTFVSAGSSLVFVSGSSSSTIKGLGDGTYTLTETGLPTSSEGVYSYAAEITFTIANGQITSTNITANSENTYTAATNSSNALFRMVDGFVENTPAPTAPAVTESSTPPPTTPEPSAETSPATDSSSGDGTNTNTVVATGESSGGFSIAGIVLVLLAGCVLVERRRHKIRSENR